jgi:hypothetical protein
MNTGIAFIFNTNRRKFHYFIDYNQNNDATVHTAVLFLSSTTICRRTIESKSKWKVPGESRWYLLLDGGYCLGVISPA